MTGSHGRLGLAAATILAVLTGRSSAAVDDTVQVMADVVLIADRCHELVVDYGALFQFARHRGLAPVDVMPLGSRRLAFDAARDARTRTMPVGIVCGDLADERGLVVPGVFARR